MLAVILFTLIILYIFGAAFMKMNHIRYHLLDHESTLMMCVKPGPTTMNSHTGPESHSESALALFLEDTQVVLAESRRNPWFLGRG